jgi:hypothetical protein
MKIASNAILVILLSFLLDVECYGQTQKLDSVKITFEGFYTESIEDISCEDFASAFKDTERVKIFSNEQDLSKFKLLVKKFKPTKHRPLDVRGEIIYWYGRSHVKYCFEVFGYFYKDDKMYYNKDLLIYIADQFYTHHPKYLDTLRQQ